MISTATSTSAIDSAIASQADSQLGVFLITGAFVILLIVHVLFTRIFSSSVSSFKRDVHEKKFNAVSTAVSLLSNPDSVLRREKVKESILGYERLFAGARKEVGATSTNDSIEHRANEYKTMVTSFYDLVTDFYEWGWGQVGIDVMYDCIASIFEILIFITHVHIFLLFVLRAFTSHFTLRLVFGGKHLRSPSSERNTTSLCARIFNLHQKYLTLVVA